MAQLDLLNDTVLGDAPVAALIAADTLASVSKEKSPGALRTISEVSAELGEETHVLRFWETKFLTLRPVKMKGGRRYYRPEDVVLLRTIRTLLHEQGYTIKGAQALLASVSNPLEALNMPPSFSIVAPMENTMLQPLSEKTRKSVQMALAELREIRSILHSFHRA